MKEGSEKLPPIISNCYCCLTSPFSQKSIVKIFAFVSLKGFRPFHPNEPWVHSKIRKVKQCVLHADKTYIEKVACLIQMKGKTKVNNQVF